MILKATPNLIAHHLEQATAEVQNLNQVYQTNNAISHADVTNALPKLNECIESLESHTFNSDQPISENLQQWFDAWTLFRKALGNDKATQEKVCNLLAGLLGNFLEKGNKIEKNLKDWKIGHKVESVSKSKAF